MNKLVRSLLSGASLATLQLCAIGVARATTISGPRGAYTNPAGSSVTSILVTNTGDITGDLTNEGTIAPGSYYGIEVNGTISGSLINAKGGVIDATEVGILVGNSASIGGGIENDGQILVGFSGATRSHRASAIDYNANAGAAITNTGLIGVNVQVLDASSSFARAEAQGVEEYGNAGFGASLTHSFSNSGAISLTAGATANGRSATAQAYAESAVKQRASNADKIEASVTNTAAISLSAAAKAVSTNSSATATARALGVFKQDATNQGSHPGSSIDLTVTNSGSLHMAATATAKGETKAKASARAGDVFSQYAYNAGDITETVSNSGSVNLAAVAKATGLSTAAKASASARGIFYQDANNPSAHNTGSIGLSLTNSALLSMAATATAKGETKAKANATAEEAFRQDAYRAGDITETISNSGSLTMTAGAKATGVGASASVSARAFAGDAFSQVATNSANFAGQSINLTVTNSGSVSMTAGAAAKGQNSAYAEARVERIFVQSGRNAAGISETISNSGSLNLAASAQATAVTTYARARAQAVASRIAYQQAGNATNSVLLPGKSIAQTITNSGDVTIALTALAKLTGHSPATVECCNEVTARATARKLFEQSANRADAITQSITNSGVIKIGAQATATGVGVYDKTRAEALVVDIFRQSVERASNSATLSLNNSGPITIALTAVANGPRISASADARSLMVQDVSESGKVSESLTNSGNITLTAVATAIGAALTAVPNNHDVSASARQGTAMKQTADSDKSVTQSLTNSGSLTFNLAAKAVGMHDVSATAQADGLKQASYYTPSVQQTLTNSASMAFSLAAHATGATGPHILVPVQDRVEATAYMGFALKQHARSSGSLASAATADMTITNSATISLVATAVAKGGTSARAEASVENFVKQSADEVGTVSALVHNSGTISIQDLAQAAGDTKGHAYVDIDAISQGADRVRTASLSVTNSGMVTLQGTATAAGTIRATAQAQMHGISQSVDFYDTSATGTSEALSVTNSGTIKLAANAKATFGLMGFVDATGTGVEQEFYQTGGTATLKNTGTIHVAAAATGLPGVVGTGVTATTTRLPNVYARASGLKVRAFGQSYTYHNQTNTRISTTPHHSPAFAKLSVSNSGTISVAAVANGLALGAANITATANAIAVQASSQLFETHMRQTVSNVETSVRRTTSGGGTVSGTVDNSGTLSASASAPGGIATANGILITADQNSVAVTNEKGGVISVHATGAAAAAAGVLIDGTHFVRSQHFTAHARSFVKQETSSSLSVPAGKFSGSITNDGTIDVTASAAGSYIGNGQVGGFEAAAGGNELPSAGGIRADGIAVNAAAMSANIVNAGTINVVADGAAAVANGIHVFAAQTGSQQVFHDSRAFVSSVSSYQTSKVHQTNYLQTALGGNTVTGKITNSGTLNVTALGTGAVAKGIDIEAGTLDSAIVNSGVIKVVANGLGAQAFGVVINAETLGSDAVFENNGGTINASVNGVRGTAIDVSGAPDTLVLALNGGSIYGNIVENAAGNAISVGSGNLVLNGIINPSRAKLGTLTVGANGTLTLGNNVAEGPATAYVHSFVQNGTLAIEAGTDGSSGSIHAANATLAGGALVDLNLSANPYGTSTTYKVVFSDSALSGTWSSVAADQARTFFSASGVYTPNEADITLTRATFDSIAGLTGNEKAVAGAIETIYDTSGGAGPLAKLFGALFELTPQQYADALESLSGIPAGELSAVDQSSLQSLLDLINGHLGSTSGGGDGGTASLMSPSPVLASNGAPSNVTPAQMSSMSGTRVWGGGFQSSNSVDRTASGPAYSSHQSGLLAGIDVPVSQNVLLGVAASWATGDIKTEKMLGFGTFNSGQFAGYGRFTADNGLYGTGTVSYGDFTNKLSRFISIPGFGSGNVSGKFDSKVWGLYGEAGWKLDPSGWAGSVTPYAALSYLDAKSDGYTETGFGVPLTIGGSSSKATSSYLGVKLENTWQMDTGTITPRLTAAWQHDFTKNAWEMSAAFAAVPTVGFGLNGSALSRDGAYIDGGITLGIADSVDVLLDYQGRFTSDRTDNAFMARANFKF